MEVKVEASQEIQRGDVFVAHYNFMGQWRTKPVLVIQNDVGNKLSPLVIVCPIVPGDSTDVNQLMSVYLDEQAFAFGGIESTTVMCNVILTLDKVQLMEKLGTVNKGPMDKVEKGLLLSLGIKQL